MSTGGKQLLKLKTLSTRQIIRKIINLESNSNSDLNSDLDSDSDSDTSYVNSSSSEEWIPPPRRNHSPSPSPPPSPLVSFDCAVCSETFDTKAAIRKHTKSSIKCRKKQKQVSSASPKHECEGCNKMFRLKCHLDRHRCANRILQVKFTCTVCKQEYSRIDRLNKHMKDKHNGKKAKKPKFTKCKFCGIRVSRKFDLIRHIRAVHFSEKPHKCDDCGEMFAVKSNMLEHQKCVHNGDAAKAASKFPCPNCDKKFTRRYNLDVHVKTVHEQKKLYVCKLCKQSLGSNRALKQHIEAKHEPLDKRPLFKCSICDKQFTQKSNLSTHEKLHKSP